MLAKLVVENLALIDYLDMDLEPGLVVLSGETGAGKSLILDALSLILGYRASTDLIRTGTDKAVVQAVFVGVELPEKFNHLPEDGQLIITREVNQNGRSVARINDRLVTVGTLRELGMALVDIHGQHEHQSLLQVEKHREVLDRFAGPAALAVLQSVNQLAADYHAQEKQLQELVGDERERERRLDILRFQQEEIAAAQLQPGEEEELAAVRRRLANYERLYNAVAQVYQLLYQGEGNLPSVSDQIRQAATELSSVQTYDQELQPWCETLQSVLYNIEDLARSLRIYQEGLAHDDAALQAVEQRLDLINNLKRKYGDTLSEVIGYAAEVEAEIQRIENSAALASRLQEKMAQTERAYRQAASELTQYRQQAAVALERQLHSHLADLGLANAVLQVQIETNTAAKPRHLGQDAILFMFNANPGEIPKPLTKVISGGEMSRLMLALKTLLASHDMVGTLVFDEIDAGLGGQQALAVGGKLRELAKTHQVICISHLANIAAMADQHLQISKSTCHDSTYTRVKCLQEQERVEEIARMLDGQLSSIALTHARELLEMAQAK